MRSATTKARGVAGLFAVFGAAAALAAPATGGGSFPSKVTLKVKGQDVGVPDYVHGRVISERAACEQDRDVRVVRRNQGTTETYGTATSDGGGRWLFEPGGTVPNGHYHAVIRLKDVRAGSCERDRSPSAFVD